MLVSRTGEISAIEEIRIFRKVVLVEIVVRHVQVAAAVDVGVAASPVVAVVVVCLLFCRGVGGGVL